MTCPRIGAWLLLVALAFLFASQGGHAHSPDVSLEASCAVCATSSQARALFPPAALPQRAPRALAIPLELAAPVLREARTRLCAAPRGPPLDA